MPRFEPCPRISIGASSEIARLYGGRDIGGGEGKEGGHAAFDPRSH